jgi:hypothetical protein
LQVLIKASPHRANNRIQNHTPLGKINADRVRKQKMKRKLSNNLLYLDILKDSFNSIIMQGRYEIKTLRLNIYTSMYLEIIDILELKL